MALQDEPQVQEIENQSLLLDALFCEELSCEEDLGGYGTDEDSEYCETLRKDQPFLALNLVENDLLNDLQSLISKEEQTHVSHASLSSDGYLIEARKEALAWIFRVKHHYAFSALTSLLAVNYFDRFLSNVRFQRDKPWMSQLAAVACFSLAAKVEETQVPLLLDLQVVESKFAFEAKTIQRMELLVLSALQWKMHPVTPISFFHHIIRRLPLKNHILWELLGRFQSLLLFILSDHRFLCYLPSVLATAIILHIISEVEPYNFLEYQNQLLSVLKINKNRLDECYKFILDSPGSHGNLQNQSNKSKQMRGPGSPCDVIAGYFISDSSNDSWPTRKLPTPGFQVEVVMIDHDGTLPTQLKTDSASKGSDRRSIDHPASGHEAAQSNKNKIPGDEENDDNVFSDSDKENGDTKTTLAQSTTETGPAKADHSSTAIASEKVGALAHETSHLSLKNEKNTQTNASKEPNFDGVMQPTVLETPNLDSARASDFKAIAADASVFTFGDEEDFDSE